MAFRVEEVQELFQMDDSHDLNIKGKTVTQKAD